ncbi:MAG: hypothetical protein AAGE92_12970 [Cyanobacteria bacterium P01_G01_bin.4]
MSEEGDVAGMLGSKARDHFGQLVEQDETIRQNTLWGSVKFILRIGDDAIAISCGNKNVSVEQAAQGYDENDCVVVSGSPEQWSRVLLEQHGGVHRAWRYHQLEFSGDQVKMLTFWKTLWRIGENLQEALRSEASGAVS